MLFGTNITIFILVTTFTYEFCLLEFIVLIYSSFFYSF